MPVIQTDKPLKGRPATDFYPTPYPCALAAVKLTPVDGWNKHSKGRVSILDPGAGLGVYGEAARSLYPNAHIVGVELNPVEPHPAYSEWRTGDFLKLPIYDYYDIIVGNPPYKLMEEFVRHSLEFASEGSGDVILMGRLEFLASAKRAKGLFKELPPSYVWVLPQRPSFTGNGKTNAMDYAYYHWRKHDLSHMDYETAVKWLNWR